MKISPRALFVAAALFLAGGFALLVAKEEKAAPGSIRPTGRIASADLPSLAKINLQQALTFALARVPGSVIKAELEVEGGSLMYSFEVVTAAKRIVEVEIDAGTGQVLNVEDDEDEKDDGHEYKAEKK